jgi:hypothetical protein
VLNYEVTRELFYVKKELTPQGTCIHDGELARDCSVVELEGIKEVLVLQDTQGRESATRNIPRKEGPGEDVETSEKSTTSHDIMTKKGGLGANEE